MLTALAGFIAGFVHVLAGPDHLAAVAPLAIEERKKAWGLGLRWGIGHTGGVLCVGAVALLLREILPIEALSSYSERLVGVVLIGIGLWAMKKGLDRRIHVHPHSHDGTRHAHVHTHTPVQPHVAPQAHRHTHAAFAVGTLHGLAGSSHILGILPALALPSTELAIGYMMAFGGGTILGMIGFSAVLGMIADRFSKSNLAIYRGLTVTCAVTAIVVGGAWLIR